MKNKLFTLLRIIISLSLIGLLVWLMRDKLPSIASTIKSSNKPLLILGFSIYLLATITIAFRLRKVISVQSIDITPKESCYLTFIGYFFNNFLPTSFGGDFVKAHYAGKKSNNKAGAFAGVFMDRVLALLPFTLVPVVTITFFASNIANKPLLIAVYSLFVGCVVIIWFLLHKNTAKYFAFLLEPFKNAEWVARIKDGYSYLNAYSDHKIVLSWSFFLSIIAQVLSVIAVHLFARSLGVSTLGIGIFFIVVPLAWIMTLIPSLNGLGVREGAFIYLLKGYIPADKAFAISILVLATITALGVIGGIIYMLKKSSFSVKGEDVE